MAKIDLKRVNVVNFQLHTDFSMSPGTFNQLFGEYSERFDDHEPVFLDTYTRQNTKHVSLAFVTKSEQEQIYTLHIDYQVDSDISRRPKSIWEPETAFNLLRPMAGVCNFNAVVRFIYPLSKFYSSMRLPISLGPDISSDLDQIWGLRLIRFTNDGNVKFNIIIDQDDEEISHTLNFRYAGELTADTIVDAFNAGVNISENFIRLMNEKVEL